jgi:hypothetical protein
MYVHVDPALLERYPWIGVLLGAAGLALGLVLARQMADDSRLFRDRAPERLSLADADALARGERRWVTLVDGEWRCDARVERERKAPERWLFGRIEETQVPIRDPAGRRLVVVRFAGAIDCPRRAGEEPSGAWERAEGSRLRRVARDILALPHEPPPFWLDASLRDEVERYSWFPAVLSLLGIGILVHFGRKWAARSGPRFPHQGGGLGRAASRDRSPFSPLAGRRGRRRRHTRAPRRSPRPGWCR